MDLKRIILVFFLFVFLSSQKNYQISRVSDEDQISYFEVFVGKLPIILEDFGVVEAGKGLHISDGRMSRVLQEIDSYYDIECPQCDGYWSLDEIYLRTIQISNSSNITLYWIVFYHGPSGKLNSSILFFDETKKEFRDYTYDFKIHAMYTSQGKEIVSTSLWNQFIDEKSEIKLVDFDHDENPDFMFNRLWHNGTSNGLEEIIIEAKLSSLDTLSYSINWIK